MRVPRMCFGSSWAASGPGSVRPSALPPYRLTAIFRSMTDMKTSPPRLRRWAAEVGSDPLDQLVHLSHLMGQDSRLVQPGGGNASTKVGDTLLVKGSGTDLRTIIREGFTR